MQTSEDLNVLKHFAKIYNMQCVGFFCFVMKHFLHIYLLKNRSELQLVLLQFVIFFLASLLLIEEVWDGESQYMCKKRHWKNALGRSNNFILFFINFCHFFFQQLQPQIQLAYKIAVFESEQTTHILKNTRPNFSLL